MRQKLLSTIIISLFSIAVYAQPSGWQYNMPITITNQSNTAFSNYIMPVVINTGVLIAANQMQANGSDMRFGSPCTGTKNYPFFIDSGINSGATLIYVDIDTIAPNSTKVIYMFYGNPNVAPVSSIGILNGPKAMDNNLPYGFTSTGLNNYNWGLKFVPNTDLFVISLGKKNNSPGNYSTKLWDANGNLLAQAIVGGPVNQYNYTDLPNPIILKAGQQYTVSVFDGGISPYDYLDLSSPTLSPEVNFLGTYYTSSGNIYPTGYWSSYPYGAADIKYYYYSSPPNPPTYVIGSPNSGGVFTQPSNSSICVGGIANFSVFTPATNQSNYWQVLQGSNWVNIGSTSPYNGSYTSNLLINGVTSAMNGNQYRDSVSNSCGSGVSNPATLTVVTPSAFVIPTASISGPNPACDNVNSLYTITTNVIGASFQWMVNNAVVDTHQAYAFHPNNNDQLYALVTAPNNGMFGCYTLPTAVSNLMSLTTGTNFVPHISVSSNVNNVCDGTQINFLSSTNVFGGAYQWQVNGINAGQNMPGYAYIPANGDQVSCTITTPSNGCYSLPSASSLPIAVTIIPNITPTLNLNCQSSASAGTHVPVSLTILNLNANYFILWYKNGVLFDSTNGPSTTFVKGSGVDNIKAIIYPQSNASIGACYASVISNIVAVSPTTGINNVQGVNPVSVAPNPFNDNVLINGLEAGDKACIYDITGRPVTDVWSIASNDQNQRFNITNIAPGTYFLRVVNRDGNSKATVTLQKL